MYKDVDLKSPGILPEKIRGWALALSQSLSVSFEIALLTLLSAMSSALCGLKVIRRPDGGLESASLIVFALAPPAYGKTRLFKRAFSAHMEEDADRLRAYLRANDELERDAEKRGASARRVRPARLRSVLLQDCSRYGLVEELSGVGESVAMATHEGNLILGSDLFRKNGLEMATSLWDGGNSVQVRRGRGTRLIAMEATMPIMVMVQNNIFDDYLATHGKHAASIGFFDRTLFICAEAGSVPVDVPPAVDDSCLVAFDDQARAYLRRTHVRAVASVNGSLEQVADGGAADNERDDAPGNVTEEPEISASEITTDLVSHSVAGPDTRLEEMALSSEAAEVFAGLCHQARNRGVWLAHLQGATSRAMQNVIRMAGLLQAFDDERVPISSQAILAANAIEDYCLGQASMVFPPEFKRIEPAVTKLSTHDKQKRRLDEDGQMILQVAGELMRLRGGQSLALSEVRERCGIYPLRFRAALARLIDAGSVSVVGEGKQERISVLASMSVFGSESSAIRFVRQW